MAVAATADRRVFAADAHPELSAACHASSGGHRLPPVHDPDFVASLFGLCDRLDVGLIVPTIDTELPVLAAVRTSFEQAGIHIAISDSEFIAECRDKRRTKELFDRVGLRSPAIYEWPDVAQYPVLAKPYDGSGSRDVMLLHDGVEVARALETVDRLILCEYCDPADHNEFTVDCYFDRQSALVCAVPRERLEVRGGEVAKAITVRNELVDELATHMAVLPGACGLVTVQAFIHQSTRATSYIEINPRVGGGFPLTRHAGADFVRYLIDEHLGGVPPPATTEWSEGALMLRYDAEIIVDV